MTPTSFRIGFTGSSLEALLPWAAEQVGDAARVVVPMAGSGKDIAYLARTGRTISSWDTQYLSKVLVTGIFAAPAALPAPVARRTRFGYAYTHEPIRAMPSGAAALADEIATVGSDYDRACLAKALIRSTYMGRLGTWARAATADTLWDGYLRAHAAFAAWRGLPGTFIHTEGSVFAEPYPFAEEVAKGAVVYVDTPKVLTRGAKGDIYSQGFEGLNSILAQKAQQLPAWTEATFRRDMPMLWTAPYSRLLLFHTTGAHPSVAEVASAMLADGVPEPTTYQTWEHRGRVDVCWVVDKAADVQAQAFPDVPRMYVPMGEKVAS